MVWRLKNILHKPQQDIHVHIFLRPKEKRKRKDRAQTSLKTKQARKPKQCSTIPVMTIPVMTNRFEEKDIQGTWNFAYVLMLLCMCPYAIIHVSISHHASVLIFDESVLMLKCMCPYDFRSKGRSKRQAIRHRWQHVRQQIPDTLAVLEIKVDDGPGRKLFNMVSSKFGVCVLMLLCVCPYVIMRISSCYHAFVLMLSCVCPHTVMIVSSFQNRWTM